VFVLIQACKKENDTIPLTITAITPDTSPAEGVVTLTGTGFNADPVQNIVVLNGKNCSVTAASTNNLTIQIPAKAGSGNIQVTTNGQTAQSPEFTYQITALVSTFAGSTRGYADGTGTEAKFTEIPAIVVNLEGSLYLSDQGNDKIRKITTSGLVSTFAGSTRGHIDGTGASAQFTIPSGLTLANNIFYVTDFHKVRTITAEGNVSTLAGSDQGYTDGKGDAAKFFGPISIARAANGTLYIADYYNQKIRRVATDGTVVTLAGSEPGYIDATGANAKFLNPASVTMATDGNLYVTDGNSRIRKVTPSGEVSTFAGSGQGYADGTLTSAKFANPNGLVIASDGSIYVADTDNHRIRKISSTGEVTTVAGSEKGYADGKGTDAKFYWPVAIALASDSILYVSEVGNFTVRKIVLR
jgi:sugar lactone lactonase YvrE